MRMSVIVKFRFEGIHSWPKCPYTDVKFLRDPHRHIFHVTAMKAVRHNDREVEIIRLKREMEKYVRSLGKYNPDYGLLLGSLSCEMIAQKFVEAFELESCTVLEDGENGAVVWS